MAIHTPTHTSELLFRRILHDYKEALYWHIRHIVGHHEDAEDALQETFIRAFRNMEQLRDASREKAWLYRIATNEALRQVERRPATDTLHDNTLSHDDAPGHDQLYQALEDAVATLPPRQRAVFSLRYYEDMSYEDIALATESNVKAVTANYHIAKERIRKYLLAL